MSEFSLQTQQLAKTNEGKGGRDNVFYVLLYRVWMVVFVFPRLGPVHIFDFNSSLPPLPVKSNLFNPLQPLLPCTLSYTRMVSSSFDFSRCIYLVLF